MHALILAGGFATRLWPLTEKRAKPLLPLLGTPIISHLIETIPTKIPITVSTNATFAEGFQKWATEISRDTLEIAVEHTKNDDEKLGALGAIAQWLNERKVNDDLLLLLGDNLLGFDLHDFINRFDHTSPLLAVFDIRDLEKAKAFGTVLMENTDAKIRTINGFEEKPLQPQSTYVSTGCAILPKHTLPILIEYATDHPDNVGGIFEEFIRKEVSVSAYCFTEPWYDIGSFDAYIAATKELSKNTPTVSAAATKQDSNLVGGTVIGEGSTIKDSTLTDTVIFDHCTITDCILDRCIIDQGSHLHGVDLTGKMIRENTVLKKA